MSDTYTKLFRSITASTIVSEPVATRWLWVTLLAQADRKGRVYGSIPGLARIANISIPEVESALDCFRSPDPYSRTPDNEGRRVADIDGGWQLLNYAKYDAMRNEAERKEAKREWDRQNRPSGHQRAKKSEAETSDETRQSDDSPTQSDETRQSDPMSHVSSPISQQQDQKQKQARKRAAPPPERPHEVDESTWDDWLTLRRAKSAPVTATVLREAEREAAKAGLPLTRFLEIWCARGSQGLQAEWLKPNELQQARAGPNGRQPMGKQAQGLMALEAMKSGNRMAAGRTADGAPEAVLLGVGAHAGR